jgi:hypothetical protein
VSGAGGIETSQLQPNDDNEQDRRKAALTCANHILEANPGAHPEYPGLEVRHQLLELLRVLGLAADPHALVRNPLAGTTGVYQPREPG